MSRDFKIFLSTLSEARVIDGIAGWSALGLSPEARRRRRQFRRLRTVFETALAEPDALIQIELKDGKPRAMRNGGTLMGVAVLITVAILVWSRFTLPGVREWLTMMMHRCGLR